MVRISDFTTLLTTIRSCRHCEPHLPAGPRPVVQASERSHILIIGQAPGRIVHETGIPWNDRSGDTLRNWLGVSREDFYDPAKFALVPMGFCFPGTGKSGDLPPRPECAPLWHSGLIGSMPRVRLTLLIGSYALKYYLDKQISLTETVRDFRKFLPARIPLPHPSPRNQLWQKRNPWFADEVIPLLQETVKSSLEQPT